MDRIINNESVAICVILSALLLDVEDIARLDLFTVMTTDQAIRFRLGEYADYAQMINTESFYTKALNRKFVEMQPVFLNAVSMLLIGGKIKKKEESERCYCLTSDGTKMASEIADFQDCVISEICKAAYKLQSLSQYTDTTTWYKDLRILL